MPKIDDFCSLLEKSKYFDELEIKIIQAMLVLRQNKKFRSTTNDIAKIASLSVTNAYKYLYTLQAKGIVESNKDKNKVFWLSQSSNPFPRIFSYIGRDYMNKKKIFSDLEKLYEGIIPITNEVWDNKKLFEHYDNNFIDRAVFLLDVAKNDILITTHKFYTDFILLDALKRASGRGVDIKIIAEEIDSKMSEKLREIGINMRLGKAWPYTIISDGRHGITIDGDGKGMWFLNYNSDYKKRFEEMWETAEEV